MKYVAEIKLPGNGIWLLSIPQRFCTEFWHGLALVINIMYCKEHMHLQLTEAWSWAFLLKPWVWQALLSLHHTAKHAPSTFPEANLGKVASGQLFWSLGLFCTTAARVLYVFLTSEKREKGGLSGLESTKRRWLKPFLF
jgi:hypothetical protein